MMKKAFVFVMATPWAQWAVGALIISIILGAGVFLWKVRQAGVKAGQDQVQQQVSTGEAQNTLTDIGESNKQSAAIASQLKIQGAQTQSAINQGLVLAGQVGALRAQLEASRQKAAAMPAQDVHAYVVSQLALRAIGDSSSGYTDSEEREISVRVTAYPILVATVKKDDETKDNLQKTIMSVSGEKAIAVNGLVQKQKDYDALGRNYVLLYNTYPHKQRGLKCFYTLWLSKCVDKKLLVPKPSDLQLPTN